MAIFHHETKIISRKVGQSACAAAAYRSGQKIEDDRYGKTHDYTNKKGIVYEQILLPHDSPDWANDRERLWNEVERKELRGDSQLAREVNIALPIELTRDEQIKLITDYVKVNYVDKGMIADVVIHDKDDGNPHAHVMLTMRGISREGGFGNKNRDWNEHSLATEYRKNWADCVNVELEKRGIEERVDHRSNEERGIEAIPQIHVGAIATEIERKLIAKGEEPHSERGDLNRSIIAGNKINELADLGHDERDTTAGRLRQLAPEAGLNPTINITAREARTTITRELCTLKNNLQEIESSIAKIKKSIISKPRAEAIAKHSFMGNDIKEANAEKENINKESIAITAVKIKYADMETAFAKWPEPKWYHDKNQYNSEKTKIDTMQQSIKDRESALQTRISVNNNRFRIIDIKCSSPKAAEEIEKMTQGILRKNEPFNKEILDLIALKSNILKQINLLTEPGIKLEKQAKHDAHESFKNRISELKYKVSESRINNNVSGNPGLNLAITLAQLLPENSKDVALIAKVNPEDPIDLDDLDQFEKELEMEILSDKQSL